MNNLIAPYVVHSVILIILQFFVLREFVLPVMGIYSMNTFIYPLIIFLLPIKTPKPLTILLAFVVGILIDFFYSSPGVHAATLLVTAFIRGSVLKLYEPRAGYRTDNSPTIGNYGLVWFMSYSATLLLIHLLIYFCIDSFTFVYIDKIIVNTLLSFGVSYFAILFYQVFIRF